MSQFVYEYARKVVNNFLERYPPRSVKAPRHSKTFSASRIANIHVYSKDGNKMRISYTTMIARIPRITREGLPFYTHEQYVFVLCTSADQSAI